jgi:multidrug efflux system membrane fusion protein
VKTDSTVTVRPITVGTTEGEDSEITSGLTPGEILVMTGVDKLQEGTKVNATLPSAKLPASASAASAPNASGKKSRKGG